MAKLLGLREIHTRRSDGLQVEVTSKRIVPMGDVFAYEQVSCLRPAAANAPAIRVVFEVRAGVPVCVSLSFDADDQTVVRPKDLASLNLADLREEVYAIVGLFEPNPEGGYVRVVSAVNSEPYRRYRRQVAQAASRRKVTPELLEKVAAVHRDAQGPRIAAVEAAFNVGQRQAMRYIRLAKDEGLIGDE